MWQVYLKSSHESEDRTIYETENYERAHLFVEAYVQAILDHTEYEMETLEDADGIYLTFRSQLVSRPTLILRLVQQMDDEDLELEDWDYESDPNYIAAQKQAQELGEGYEVVQVPGTDDWAIVAPTEIPEEDDTSEEELMDSGCQCFVCVAVRNGADARTISKDIESCPVQWV